MVATATLTAGCTYSDGSMGAHEDDGHHHGGGLSHAAGEHTHETAGDGLVDSLHGYTLEVTGFRPRPEGTALEFRIRNQTGAPQLQYTLDHGKLLHLYVVSEDLSKYHHVHPVLDTSGFWSVDLPRLGPGRHHVVASFVAIDDESAEHALMLGTDVTVDGQAPRRKLPGPADVVRVDGLDVELAGDLALTQESALTLTVTRNRRPVPLQVRLQSWAHVTAVHEASLAVTHIHPHGLSEVGDPPPDAVELGFTPEAPGRYRIFVEVATESGVHRAAFTRDVCC